MQRSGTQGRTTVSGHIQDFTGEELILETGAGVGVQRYPVSEIVSISTRYLPAHEQGQKLLQQGRAAEAWEQLTAALDQEPRRWVRREILAVQVRCALYQQDYQKAITRFLAITQSDPLTQHYRLIPLVWTEQPPGTIATADVRGWLASKDLPTRLIGASWLLHDSGSRDAQFVLHELAKEPHPFVQRLAQAQLWRQRLAERDLSAAEIQRWEHLVDGWSPVIRPGPYFLIGNAFALREEWLLAAANWLWLPLHYQERRDLAAEAQLRSARGLERSGDTASAQRLAFELTVRYVEQPQAATAREIVDRLSNTTAPATMP